MKSDAERIFSGLGNPEEFLPFPSMSQFHHKWHRAMGSRERQLFCAFPDRSCPSLALEGVAAGEKAGVWRLRRAGLTRALLAAWILLASTQAAQSQPRGSVEEIDVLDHGIYEPMKGKLPKGVPPYTSDDVQLVGVTDFIPAQLGIEFGFRYKIVGHPRGAPIAIKTVILFPSPGAVSPRDGLLHASTLVKNERIGGVKAIAYRLDEPWELVPGIWTIQLWVGSQKFAEHSFTMKPRQTAMN